MDNSKRVFLFDLDGTLTEARQAASTSVGPVLRDLSKLGRIVIVTGSDYDFIEEQLKAVWCYIPCSLVTLMPCNGTKKYVWKKASFKSRFDLVESMSMKNHVGLEKYKKLITYIAKRQVKFLEKYDASDHVSGRFVSYRGSMINWSPMGRDGSSSDRDVFISHDEKHDYRKHEIDKMKKFAKKNEIDVKISYGGDTSFDIFPRGWDKTLALKDIENESIWFFGDRCAPGGNDFEIYEKVREMGGSAFHVQSPEETLSILSDIIKELT